MKQSVFIKIVLLICSCYMITQFIIIPVLLGKEENKSLLEVSQSRKKLVRHFLGQYQSLHIPLVILELDILQKTSSVPEINKLLTEQDSLTFGLFEDNRAHLELHIQHFEDLGFTIRKVVQDVDDSQRSKTTHYLLYTDSVFIHIMVFLKVALSLVHTSLAQENLPRLQLYRNQKPFLSNSGIFSRFDVNYNGGLLEPSPLKQLLQELPYSTYTPCNHTRAASFLAKHPQDTSEDSERFQRKARQVLARATQILDLLEVPFWLSSGTCLGWFRQCGVISYSQDVDIGIFIKDYNQNILSLFERGGFFLKNVFGKVSDSYELSFQAGEIKLDIFFFYEEKDHMWNGGTHDETGQKYRYIFPKFNLCWTIFLELKVRVPCPAEPYIVANYGNNWTEPVKQWEWNKSPPNVRENGYWPKEEWPEVIQVY